jgi:hypothetical protein
MYLDKTTGLTLPGAGGTSGGGADTSDATAKPEDVAAGKTFYGANGKETGFLLESQVFKAFNEQSATPGILREPLFLRFPFGRVYFDETLNEICVEEGLVTNEKIKVPMIEFYKCTSVNTSSKTWMGKRAVFSGGIYHFAEVITKGLTYTDIVPEVGGIYANGTNVCVAYLNTGFPEGYVFFDALSSSDGWTMNGATVVQDDNRTVFQTVNDWGEAQSAVITTDPGVPLGNAPRSLSFWFKRTGTNENTWCGIGYGYSWGNQRIAWGLVNDYPGLTYWGHDYFQSEYGLMTDTLWHHVVVTFDGKISKCYVDSSLLWTWESGEINTSWEYINVGDPWEGYQSNGRYADYYIYPRVLQSFEITQLYEARTV